MQLTPASWAFCGLVASGIQLCGFGEAGQRWLVQLKPDPLGGRATVENMTDALPPTIEGPAQRPRRPLRFLLFAGLGVLAIIGVLFVALILWAMRGVTLAEEAGVAGREFGTASTDAGCLRAAVERHSGGYSGHFSLDEAEFLRECLKVASPTATFCENIPLPSDEHASRAWYESRCAEVGIAVETCANLFSAQQYHCLERNNQSGRVKTPG